MHYQNKPIVFRTPPKTTTEIKQRTNSPPKLSKPEVKQTATTIQINTHNRTNSDSSTSTINSYQNDEIPAREPDLSKRPIKSALKIQGIQQGAVGNQHPKLYHDSEDSSEYDTDSEDNDKNGEDMEQRNMSSLANRVQRIDSLSR